MKERKLVDLQVDSKLAQEKSLALEKEKSRLEGELFKLKKQMDFSKEELKNSKESIISLQKENEK